jgi:hypothetical protein
MSPKCAEVTWHAWVSPPSSSLPISPFSPQASTFNRVHLNASVQQVALRPLLCLHLLSQSGILTNTMRTPTSITASAGKCFNTTTIILRLDTNADNVDRPELQLIVCQHFCQHPFSSHLTTSLMPTPIPLLPSDWPYFLKFRVSTECVCTPLCSEWL